MIPLAVRITNFRSIRETQTFRFPQEPGLYFLQGVNEAEPRLEANGAGKSTIWDALTWCWFGKTARGLKAGDVCNWDAGKGAEVEFDFMLPGDDACIWTMKRTWSPNSWTLSHLAEYITDEQVIDLAKEKDNPVFAWLGLDFESWVSCILMAQGQPMFLDQKREAQASLFSSVIGADSWLEHSATASKKASDEDRRLRDMERELSNLRGRLEATSGRDYMGEADQWASTHNRKMKDLEEEHGSLLTRRKAWKKQLDEAVEREINARAWVASSKPDAALEKDYNRAAANVSDYELMRREQENEARRLLGELEKFEKGAGSCPVCGSRMSEAHRQKELTRLTRAAEECHAKATRFAREYDSAQADVERHQEKYEEQVSEHQKARDELDEAQKELGNARRTLDLLDRDLDRIEDDHDALKAERNPYEDMERKAQEEARALRAEIERLQARIDSANERYSLFRFWVGGFKDVRLMKIDEALTELEVEANSGVDALGLLGWELQFQVDRETKAGKFERGFNVYVRSPANDRQVPWEAWSGGEGQRLRLAGNMGLSDLIRSRTGATIPLEVWDEPTQGLSPQGIRDLLECLVERAQRERRVIWLVDHKAHDFGGFAGGAIITKGPKGSIISEV